MIIGGLISLILLPLRLIGPLVGLALLPVKIILRLLTRNLYLLIIVVAAALIYVAFQNSAPPRQVTPARMAPRSQDANGQAPVIDPVLKREDGNSAFAADLYASMNDGERAYYSQLFFHVLNTVPDGTAQTWQNANINGTITPTSTFRNKSGGTCRKFKETLKVHTIEQTLGGTACLQTNGSWCKLKLNATPSCGLGRKPGLLQSIRAAF